MRILLAIIGAVAAALAAAFALLVFGTRTGNRRIIGVVTRLQRDVLNPGAMTTAGTAASPYAVVEHVGRTSGRSYETPVGVIREGDDWYVALPYGDQTSWARNIASAGEAIIRIDGERHLVGDVQIVPIAQTPLTQQQPGAIRLFGIRWAVRVAHRGLAEQQGQQSGVSSSTGG